MRPGTPRTIRDRLTEALAPPPLAPDVRSLYRRTQNEVLLDRFRRGVPFGALACVVVAVVGGSGQPAEAAWTIRLGGFAAAACAFAALPLSRTAPIERHPNVLLFLASIVVAAAGALIAAFTGGFESVATATITLLWVFGSIVTPLSPRSALIDALGQLAVATLVIVRVSPHTGSPAMFAVLNGFGIGFLWVGLTLREQATVRAFLLQRSLDEANRDLASLNADLERRVDEQVHEIRRHAADVEVLNAQLQQRVIDRSQELAVALSRVGRPARISSPPVGAILNGRLRLVRAIDSGGMGDVFEGYDDVTATRVAVKTIHGRRLSDVATLQRFLGEARAAASVVHEGIVRTLDVDVTEDGTLFHVMELVEGSTFGEWMKRTRRRSVGTVARVGRVVAEAMAAAHAAGIVHRDIKPANIILIAKPPGAKLLDFGVSRIIARSEETASGAPIAELLGTPAYMAPEQARDATAAGPPADVYSLGVVLYEALSGALPFEGTTGSEYIALHASASPADLEARRPEIPRELSRIVMRCLRKDPLERPSAPELATALVPFVGQAQELDSESRAVEGCDSTVAAHPETHARARAKEAR
jgi:tRNA A-37 threonylcarbamoyl transferase component Bud32